MDLDDFKDQWSDYDKKLDKNLELNESLLREMNLGKAKNELSKPFYYALLSVAFSFFLVFFFITGILRFQEVSSYFVLAIIGLLCSVIILGMGLLQVRTFLQMDYYNSPILELQKQLLRLKTTILKVRIAENVLMCGVIICLTPLMVKMVHGQDLMDHIGAYSWRFAFGLLVAMPIYLWINKYLFDQKLENAKRFFETLEKFEV